MIHHRHHQTTFNAICIDGYASGNDIAWCNILFYKGSWNLFRSQHVNKLMPHWKTSILFSGIFSAYVWLQLKSISRSWSLLWRDKVALQSFCHFYVYKILYNLTIHNYVINGQIVGKSWRRRIDGAALVRFKKNCNAVGVSLPDNKQSAGCRERRRGNDKCRSWKLLVTLSKGFQMALENPCV